MYNSVQVRENGGKRYSLTYPRVNHRVYVEERWQTTEQIIRPPPKKKKERKKASLLPEQNLIKISEKHFCVVIQSALTISTEFYLPSV